MKVNQLTSAMILGLGLLALASSASAGKPEGKGKQAEETASKAQLYDTAGYALRGDGEVEGDEEDTSLYQDATLEDSSDCALVIATRIDKQSGTAFLWTPSPRNNEDNCDTFGFNRWFVSDYAEFGAMVFAKITFGGLYRPLEDVNLDGVTVSIAIGPYRIEHQQTANVVIDDSAGRVGYGDIRSVEIGSAPASICKWQATGKKGKQSACLPVSINGGPDGEIALPLKVKFTRLPPQ